MAEVLLFSAGSSSEGCCLVVIFRDGDEAKYILLDTGISRGTTYAEARKRGLNLEPNYLFPTHAHQDHYREFMRWMEKDPECLGWVSRQTSVVKLTAADFNRFSIAGKSRIEAYVIGRSVSLPTKKAQVTLETFPIPHEVPGSHLETRTSYTPDFAESIGEQPGFFSVNSGFALTVDGTKIVYIMDANDLNQAMKKSVEDAQVIVVEASHSDHVPAVWNHLANRDALALVRHASSIGVTPQLVLFGHLAPQNEEFAPVLLEDANDAWTAGHRTRKFREKNGGLITIPPAFRVLPRVGGSDIFGVSSEGLKVYASAEQCPDWVWRWKALNKDGTEGMKWRPLEEQSLAV